VESFYFSIVSFGRERSQVIGEADFNVFLGKVILVDEGLADLVAGVVVFALLRIALESF
jgi:hypothetical protein